MTGKELNEKWHRLNGWKREMRDVYVGSGETVTSLVWVDGEGDFDWVATGALPPLNVNVGQALKEAKKVLGSLEITLQGDRAAICWFPPRTGKAEEEGEHTTVYEHAEGPYALNEAILKALIKSKEQK